MAALASHLQPALRAIQPPIKLRDLMEQSKLMKGCMAVLREPSSVPSDLVVRLNPAKLLAAVKAASRHHASAGPPVAQLPPPSWTLSASASASSSAPAATVAGGSHAASPTGGGSGHEAFDIALPNAKVCGINTLNVRLMSLSSLTQDDISWLLGGGAATTASSPTVRFVGFDTARVVDRLALIQLGCAERVLLIRVPKGQKPIGTAATAAAAAVAVVAAQATGASRGRRRRAEAAPLPAASIGCELQHLQSLLDSDTVLKAGSEVWQALLMVHNCLGLHVQGGACLAALNEDNPRLFTVLETKYPNSGLKKDTMTTYSRWLQGELSPQQIRYSALNAFASWAVAAATADLTQVMVIADFGVLIWLCSLVVRTVRGGHETRCDFPPHTIHTMQIHAAFTEPN